MTGEMEEMDWRIYIKSCGLVRGYKQQADLYRYLGILEFNLIVL